MAVPNISDLITVINNYKIRLNEAMNTKINYQKLYLESIKNSFVIKNPMIMYENKKQKLDSLCESIQNIFINYIKNCHHQLDLLKSNYILNNPQILYKDKKVYLGKKNKKLELINPLGVLKRGYSLTYQNNKIVKSIKDIQLNNDLVIKLHDGNLVTHIEKIEEINNE